jgi:hypothetical protein
MKIKTALRDTCARKKQCQPRIGAFFAQPVAQSDFLPADRSYHYAQIGLSMDPKFIFSTHLAREIKTGSMAFACAVSPAWRLPGWAAAPGNPSAET